MDVRISFFLIFTVIATTYGLKCHQCNSHDDETCNDPFTKDTPTECPADGNTYTICRKIYQYIRDEPSVIRSCGYEKWDKYDGDCYTTVLEEYNTEVCSCAEDGCNGTSGLSPLSLFSVTLMAVAAHLVNK